MNSECPTIGKISDHFFSPFQFEYTYIDIYIYMGGKQNDWLTDYWN